MNIKKVAFIVSNLSIAAVVAIPLTQFAANFKYDVDSDAVAKCSAIALELTDRNIKNQPVAIAAGNLQNAYLNLKLISGEIDSISSLIKSVSEQEKQAQDQKSAVAKLSSNKLKKLWNSKCI